MDKINIKKGYKNGVRAVELKDLNEILLLQKLAFKPEAIKHNDLTIPPMTQTDKEIIKEFEEGKILLKYIESDNIVGSVRAYKDDKEHCYIGRLVVHPDYQRKGIGTLLMKEIEKIFKNCKKFKIFTGEKSDHVISYYKKLGYKETHRENAGTYNLVYLQKINLDIIN